VNNIQIIIKVSIEANLWTIYKLLKSTIRGQFMDYMQINIIIEKVLMDAILWIIYDLI